MKTIRKEKHSNRTPKMDPKNDPKMTHNALKNRPRKHIKKMITKILKMTLQKVSKKLTLFPGWAPWGAPGALLGRPCPLLGLSWDTLGRSWPLWGGLSDTKIAPQTLFDSKNEFHKKMKNYPSIESQQQIISLMCG